MEHEKIYKIYRYCGWGEYNDTDCLNDEVMVSAIIKMKERDEWETFKSYAMSKNSIADLMSWLVDKPTDFFILMGEALDKGIIGQTTVIDIEKEFWDEIKKAASESQWIPKEYYYMNDWVADVCKFLRNGYGNENE